MVSARLTSSTLAFSSGATFLFQLSPPTLSASRPPLLPALVLLLPSWHHLLARRHPRSVHFSTRHILGDAPCCAQAGTFLLTPPIQFTARPHQCCRCQCLSHFLCLCIRQRCNLSQDALCLLHGSRCNRPRLRRRTFPLVRLDGVSIRTMFLVVLCLEQFTDLTDFFFISSFSGACLTWRLAKSLEIAFDIRQGNLGAVE